LPQMLQALRDERQRVRINACRALGGVGGPQARGVLAAMMTDADQLVAEEAARALRETGEPEAVPLLLPATHAPYYDRVRWMAIEALGRLRDKRAVPTLVGLLSDRNVLFASVAATALGEIGDPSTITSLRQVCDGTSPTAHYNNSEKAMLALTTFGEKVALPVLLPLTGQKDPQVREAALSALAKVPGPEAQAALKSALQDENEQVRDCARRSLLRRAGWGTAQRWPWR